MNAQTATFKFTVEDYCRLYEVGILDEQDRIELLNGELNIMQAIGSRHARTVENLISEFGDVRRRRFTISPQHPVELDQLSLPQPDFMLIPFDPRRKVHPKAADLLLLVEVSDSSLSYDRETKLRAYARTGIAEYWIVNLISDVIEVFRKPQGETYLESACFGMDAAISPAAFQDIAIKVSDIISDR